MVSTARHPLSTNYCVEVSGWDDAHSFFVEKSELAWDEESGKHLTLSRRLCPGTMIFVRLLQPLAAEHAFPVAYHAEPEGTTSEGRQIFRVTRMQPRIVRTESTRF
jgi:hypothetical protein